MRILLAAWRESAVEMRKQVSSVLVFWPFLLVAVLLCAIFFAVRDYRDVNVLASFAAGLVSGSLYFVLGYGALISWAFLSIFTYRVSKAKYERPISYAKSSHDEVHGRFAVYGVILTLIWVVPTFWAASQIPVVGDQMAFMFRDRGD